MKRTVLCLGIAGIVAWSAGISAQTRAVKKLQLEQFFDMETASNPRISPDGKQIIYTRGWVDKVNDRRSSALWIMNADDRGTVSPTDPARSGRPMARASPRATASQRSQICALDGRRRCGDANHPSRAKPVEHRLVARRQVDRLHHARAQARVVADSMPARPEGAK
jgi:dipeptidyl aminopeptidase/acylaminoacyl peptidase